MATSIAEAKKAIIIRGWVGVHFAISKNLTAAGAASQLFGLNAFLYFPDVGEGKKGILNMPDSLPDLQVPHSCEAPGEDQAGNSGTQTCPIPSPSLSVFVEKLGEVKGHV